MRLFALILLAQVESQRQLAEPSNRSKLCLAAKVVGRTWGASDHRGPLFSPTKSSARTIQPLTFVEPPLPLHYNAHPPSLNFVGKPAPDSHSTCPLLP